MKFIKISSSKLKYYQKKFNFKNKFRCFKVNTPYMMYLFTLWHFSILFFLYFLLPSRYVFRLRNQLVGPFCVYFCPSSRLLDHPTLAPFLFLCSFVHIIYISSSFWKVHGPFLCMCMAFFEDSYFAYFQSCHSMSTDFQYL